MSLVYTILFSLRRIPIFGILLKTVVDPIYRTILRINPSKIETDNFKEHVQCFEGLGCLETTKEFYDPINRPSNLPTESREIINTHFVLFTRRHPQGTLVTRHDVHQLQQTPFDPNIPTKLIIHGFLDDGNSTWVKEMREGLLFHSNCNVFVVDWSGGSKVLFYQSVFNCRLLALELIALIKWMIQRLQYSPSMVHIIGHSLGAHTAGYVGKAIRGLGRITGLDPAEQFFEYLPPVVGLHHTDALFVDIIHSDVTVEGVRFGGPTEAFGLLQPIGHVDFYPNGGRRQPGCSSFLDRLTRPVFDGNRRLSQGLDVAEKDATTCNHFMAIKLFTASLFSNCSFQAFPCNSYKQYTKGSCFSCQPPLGCASLGINADAWSPNRHSGVKMFLSTFRDPHFCKYHYRLTIRLADDNREGGYVRGRLKIALITEQGNILKFDLTSGSATSIKRGSNKSFLLDHHQDLSATKDVIVSWTSQPDVLNHQTVCASLCSTHLEVTTVIFAPLDTPKAVNYIKRYGAIGHRVGASVMCHRSGKPTIVVPSGRSVAVTASPFCSALRTKNEPN